ncbi:unnamed protein product [Mycena citricolor]|uniref:Uncharacterized protein n=1 Tax=Mycena citricolor TaxID=2018698 RepID=A0AAD2HG74_9AGAR|nr:unnamed protein product [Mycena citricolor]
MRQKLPFGQCTRHRLWHGYQMGDAHLPAARSTGSGQGLHRQCRQRDVWAEQSREPSQWHPEKNPTGRRFETRMGCCRLTLTRWDMDCFV